VLETSNWFVNVSVSQPSYLALNILPRRPVEAHIVLRIAWWKQQEVLSFYDNMFVLAYRREYAALSR